jgi:hypothetical protein
MRVICLGAAALLAASLASGQALARDDCPRLESASLVIVIPEGGCGADAESVLAATREVTVIRGAGRPTIIRAASAGTEQEARVRIVLRKVSGTSVIFIDQSR